MSAQARTDAQTGWHPVEWACEFLGTMLLLIGGLSAVCLDFGPHHPPGSHSLRLLLTGALFAGSGLLVTLSPLGKRSGAHLNPSVTLGFGALRHLAPGDVVGYLAAQLAGAITGTAIVRLLWGADGRQVQLGLTQPGDGLHAWAAVAVEAFMTALLVGLIFFMVSKRSTARWTPFVVWALITLEVWQGAKFTGTSLNPARSLGPALLVPHLSDYWVYVVGPLAGTTVALGLWALAPQRKTLTAKLFHSRHYPSVMRSELPVSAPAQ